MKRAFTIVRVSEEDQLRGYGPDVQAAEVQAYLAGAGLTQVDCRTVQEESTTWDRPKFEAILDEAIDLKRRGELEAVVFPRTDRLARKWDAFGYYLGKLRREGLEIHFAREKMVAPDDPMQAAMLFLQGAKAHADADTIRANTMEARRKRAEKGHMMPSGGRKWAFYYHRYSRHSYEPPDSNSGRYTLNPEKAAWVKRWVRWILEDGRSVGWCCQQMTEAEGIKWWPSTMVKILSDPALVGRFYAYRTRKVRGAKGSRKLYLKPEEWQLVYEDRLAAILSPQEFYALQDKFEQNRLNARRNTGHWYPPLRALIFCGCGRRMTGHMRKGQPWYRCIRCSREINGVRLWDQIREGLREILLSPERLVPAVKAQLDSGQSLAYLEEELRANQQRLDILEQAEQKALRLHLYMPSYPAEKLEAEFRRIGEQRCQVRDERAILERQFVEVRQAMVDEEGVRRFCQIAAHNLDSLDDGQWRALLETMRLRILVQKGGIPVARVAVPTAKSEKDVIALSSSPYGRRGEETNLGDTPKPPSEAQRHFSCQG